MLSLAALGAREKSLCGTALAIVGFLLVLSLTGQYAYLLRRAAGQSEIVGNDKDSAAAVAGNLTATRSELATVQVALDAEPRNGRGAKARGASRADALRGRIAMISNATAAGEVVAHRSPMLVLCERFGIPEDLALKIAAEAFLVGCNVAGLFLLFVAARGRRRPVLSPWREFP